MIEMKNTTISIIQVICFGIFTWGLISNSIARTLGSIALIYVLALDSGSKVNITRIKRNGR